MFWQNCTSIITNSINNGYDVVFNYILSKEQVLDIKQMFLNCEIKFICLLVDEKTIVERDKLRPIDCQMGKRSLILLKEMKEKNFDKNNILDTTNLSVDETYLEIINNKRFILK